MLTYISRPFPDSHPLPKRVWKNSLVLRRRRENQHLNQRMILPKTSAQNVLRRGSVSAWGELTVGVIISLAVEISFLIRAQSESLTMSPYWIPLSGPFLTATTSLPRKSPRTKLRMHRPGHQLEPTAVKEERIRLIQSKRGSRRWKRSLRG